MTAHLGNRVSALLDGQLSITESEAAWTHVHMCHLCRDQVEREGWVKTRLAGLSFDSGLAPDHLKGALLGMPPDDLLLAIGRHHDPLHPHQQVANRSRPRRVVGIAALGGGAVGAAVMGVLALGTAPADVPSIERRQQPTSQVTTPSTTPQKVPIRLGR